MDNDGLRPRLARLLRRAIGRRRGQEAAPSPAHPSLDVSGAAYPGDFMGTPQISYHPNPANGKVAEPGEIVWAWVPFQEDHSQGKDRPVLVIGRDGSWLLALPLTSKNHDPHETDGAAPARPRGRWTDIGVGPWDRRGRASEVRTDRILRVPQAGVRRAGAVLDERRFNQVAAAVRGAR